MQDLTLIRDEDTLPLQGPDGRLRPSPSSLLDTIEDLGTGKGQGVGIGSQGQGGGQVREMPGSPCSFLPTPGDDPALSLRSSTNQTDTRTETSEDDVGDKAPKRVKSIKKVPKAEVRAQARAWGDGEGAVAPG